MKKINVKMIMLSIIATIVVCLTNHSASNLVTSAYESISYGIDVSYHNGTISWDKVKSAGIDFAIIRAGFGKYEHQKDKQFDNNIIGAQNAGLKCGVYWYSYALSPDEAIKEAEVCYSIINGYDFDLPVYYDLEDRSLLNAGLSRDQITEIGVTFCEQMKAYGYEAGIYANRTWYNNYLNKSEFINRNYSIWYAAYPSDEYAVNPLDYDCSDSGNIWQYSDKGVINGIASEYVDLDVEYVNEVISPSTDEETEEPINVSGDVSCNNVVNSVDALLFYKYLNGQIEFDDNQMKYGDTNSDGIVNIVDFILLKNKLTNNGGI